MQRLELMDQATILIELNREIFLIFIIFYIFSFLFLFKDLNVSLEFKYLRLISFCKKLRFELVKLYLNQFKKIFLFQMIFFFT